MAHIQKSVSCKHIIAKIARTFNPPDSSWIKTCIEDIGWAIQAIGYHAGFENRVTSYPYIKVKNNRAKIPCDVERIIHVEYLQSKITGSNTLNPDGTTPFPLENESEEDFCNKHYKGFKLKLGSDTSIYGTPRTTDVNSYANYYNLTGEYIVTQFESGLIRLHYIAFPTDKDGYPLIIDDFDYKSCIEFYLVSQMILKGMKHPELSYKDAFYQYEIYRLRAENAVKMLSLDAADRLENVWNRYINSVDLSTNFYMNLEQPEYISRS